MKTMMINDSIIINLDRIFSVRLEKASVFIYSSGWHATEHKFDNEQDAIESFNNIVHKLKEVT